jgi:hypothetical protein
MLRIYIDTNDMGPDGWCYLLRYNNRPLDEVATELRLCEGMPVVLYHSDPSEEFEFDGVLSFRENRWLARADRGSYRLIRQAPLQ